MEVIREFFTSGDVWAVVVKVLVTAILSALVGLIGTLTGKIIVKNKESKIYKYAKTCVEAAEMKFPNEGKKMGPEKMAYVMDQLAIKFPKIKENTYFYNIAEAAVLELNKDREKEAAIREFEEKYGEKPLAVIEAETPVVEKEENITAVIETIKAENTIDSEKKIVKEAEVTTTPTKTTTPKKYRLSSF